MMAQEIGRLELVVGYNVCKSEVERPLTHEISWTVSVDDIVIHCSFHILAHLRDMYDMAQRVDLLYLAVAKMAAVLALTMGRNAYFPFMGYLTYTSIFCFTN